MKAMKIMALIAVVLAAWFWWHQTPQIATDAPTPTPIVQPKQMGPIIIASPTGLDESGPKSALDRFNENRSKAFERPFSSPQPQ
jgi:hypothetical protein